MSVTIENLESNFAEFSDLEIKHKQDYYIVTFKHLDAMINIHVSKDLDYLFVESNEIDFSELNTRLVFDKSIKNINTYLDHLIKTSSNSNINQKEDYNDIFGIFREREMCNKGNCNYDELTTVLKESKMKSELSVSKIPKNILYSSSQIIDIIIKEIKKVNSNKEYPHYISAGSEPYMFDMHIRLSDSNKNPLYIHLTMEIDPELYPFIPPKIKYISPSAKRSLVYNFSNISVLQLENWNPTISFEWLITNIAENLNNLKTTYIENNEDGELNEIDRCIIEFSSLIGEKLYSDIKLDFDYVKFSLTGGNSTCKENKYWKSGVGYGYSGRNEWDIKKFVKDNIVKNNNIANILNRISNAISDDNVSSLLSSNVMKYFKTSLANTTLLEVNKNKVIYEAIVPLMKKIFNHIKDDQYKLSIHKGIEIMRQDISPLLGSIQDESLLPFYVNIISLADYISDNIDVNKIVSVVVNENDLEVKDIYNKMIKDEQEKMFTSGYTIKSNHRYSSKKSSQLNPKSLMRITSEFSSLRLNLPINWDTSIVVRAASENLNIFSFVITGPKDTPYHNGIYEFHAYFPDNYPNCEPKVLLDTTGNASVRFNPNLYNCGKVCLSLLGTWSGQDGESWNKDTSTFLQVLISIQSLILVEKPYFNEPGWERDMHTEKGKSLSFNYNDNIRLQNLKWAIVDKLKNPAYGFESLIKEHFKLKKAEINETVTKWIDESYKFKQEMTKYLAEFNELVNSA